MSSAVTTVSTELERRLLERIRREGPITFRDFMEAVLYDPELGYYNTERLKIGPDGDYYTSSNVHPAFGATLARAFVELWSDSKEPLTIVELGAGTGQLASDILTAMQDEHASIFDRLVYLIVETSPVMIARQREKLTDFENRVRWCELNSFERAPITGIAFSNELIDALPVHRLRIRSAHIEELFITAVEGEVSQLALCWNKPSSQRPSKYVSRMDLELADGQEIEVNLDAVDLLNSFSRVLNGGFLVTIDYGDLARDLWSPERRQGTLRSFYRHRLVDSPLERVGEQDITASVNFTALIEYGRDFGFETMSFERQTTFLYRMGLIDRVSAARPTSESIEELNQRLAVKNLFVPGGASENFRVLIQRKERHPVHSAF